MPGDQGVESSPALLVLGTGVKRPARDVGIGGNGGTGCSRVSGGLGQTGHLEAGGAVEHAQSSRLQASPASGGRRDSIAFLLGESINLVLAFGQRTAERIAPRLCGGKGRSDDDNVD